MADMDEIFDNDALDKIGKVLVLSSGHKLKHGDIKRLTMADAVRKIQATENPDIGSFVIHVLSNAIHIIENNLGRTDFYWIGGEKASSTLLALKSPSFKYSLKFDSGKIKKLHNACVLHSRINWAIHQMQQALQTHTSVANQLNQQKIKSKISEKTENLEVLLTDYGVDDLDREYNIVKSLMTNTW